MGLIIQQRLCYPVIRTSLATKETKEHKNEDQIPKANQRQAVLNLLAVIFSGSEFSKSSYNFGVGPEDHSAQFRGTNMLRHEFWKRLLDEFDLEPDGSF